MIADRITSIVEDLELFDNDLDKYEYIVDLGKGLPLLDESLKKSSFLVKGCTSKVWLIPEYVNGEMNYHADSNSAVVKGLISILIAIYSKLSPEEILKSDPRELERLMLSEIISPTRQNGVYHMVNQIRHYAEVYKDK